MKRLTLALAALLLVTSCSTPEDGGSVKSIGTIVTDTQQRKKPSVKIQETDLSEVRAQSATDEAIIFYVKAVEEARIAEYWTYLHEEEHREVERKRRESQRYVAAPNAPPPSTTPALQQTQASGSCGGWEGVISTYFSDVGTACRVMMCESGGNPHATNPSGASGLFQVMPEWADEFKQITGLPYYDGRFNGNASAQFAAWLVSMEGWASQFDCY